VSSISPLRVTSSLNLHTYYRPFSVFALQPFRYVRLARGGVAYGPVGLDESVRA
jgi:hypothetical protein